MNEHLRRSREQERRGAARLNGTVNSGSGNGWKRKNDVRNERFSVEYKTTSKKSYRITKADIQGAWTQAVLDARTLLFGIEIDGLSVILIQEDDFFALLEELEGK